MAFDLSNRLLGRDGTGKVSESVKRIDIHAFFGALSQYARGKVRLAQIVNAFDLVNGEIVELRQWVNKMPAGLADNAASLLFLSEFHECFLIASGKVTLPGYATAAQINQTMFGPSISRAD